MMLPLSASTQAAHRTTGGVETPRAEAHARKEPSMFVERRLKLSLLLAASLLLAPVVSAQTATGDWSALKAIASGSKLSVKLKTGKTVEGRLTGVSDDALSLAVGGKTSETRGAGVFR